MLGRLLYSPFFSTNCSTFGNYFARTEVGAQYSERNWCFVIWDDATDGGLEHEVEEVEEVEQSEVSTSVETVEEAVVQTEPEIVTQPAPASPVSQRYPLNQWRQFNPQKRTAEVHLSLL